MLSIKSKEKRHFGVKLSRDASGVGEVEHGEWEEFKANSRFPYQVHQEVS